MDSNKDKGLWEDTFEKQTPYRSDDEKATTAGGITDSSLKTLIPSKPNIEKTTTGGGDAANLGGSYDVENDTSTPLVVPSNIVVPPNQEQGT